MLFPDVPVMNSNLTRENRAALLVQMKAAKVRRVWIAFDRATLFGERAEALALLEENLRFFESNGLEAGVWFQALGFGDPAPRETGWTLIRSLGGKEKQGCDCFCPEDEGFTAAYLDWVRDIARQRPRLMMPDDDLCLSVRPGIGCFCEKHRKLLGDIDPAAIFAGGKNPHRDRYLQVMGDTLRRFCRKVRAAVDEIDPTIRMGQCAGYTSWDLEGVDPPELARILAGNTKPFFRLTAAPYWVAKNRFPGQRLSAVIENARNQAAWCKEIEIFAEADSYPRPCYKVPASLVENFDIAMHASGIRSLKYLFSYFSTAEYEKQYWKLHTRNLPFYERLEAAFGGTTPCGVRVFRPARRMEKAIFEQADEKTVMRSYFSKAAALLACHGIPVSYEKGENAVVFGDDVLFYQGAKRVVLDLPAALLMEEDVGLASVGDTFTPAFEHFGGETVQTDAVVARHLTLKEGAEVQSRFENGAVASYLYKNYLVLNFEGGEDCGFFCNYKRGAQLREFFGNPYPAIGGYTGVYGICAEKEGGHVVLFQNHSADPIFDFEITLPKECKAFTLYGAQGSAEGNKLRITTDFAPQGNILLEIQYADE